jgi:hypothetical protein
LRDSKWRASFLITRVSGLSGVLRGGGKGWLPEKRQAISAVRGESGNGRADFLPFGETEVWGVMGVFVLLVQGYGKGGFWQIFGSEGISVFSVTASYGSALTAGHFFQQPKK